MRPPLFVEHQRLQEELYNFYGINKRLPSVQELSKESPGLLETKITYSPDAGLSYKYEKEYPMNPPFIGLFTFGKIYPKTDMHIGFSLTPESVKQNHSVRFQKSAQNQTEQLPAVKTP